MIRALRPHTRRLVGPGRTAQPPDTATRFRTGGLAAESRSIEIPIALAAGVWGITVAWLASGIGDPGTSAGCRRYRRDYPRPARCGDRFSGRAGVGVRRVRLGWAVVGVAMLVYALGDVCGPGWTSAPAACPPVVGRRCIRRLLPDRRRRPVRSSSACRPSGAKPSGSRLTR